MQRIAVFCFYLISGLYDDGKGSDGMPYTTLSYADGPGGEIEQNSYNTVGTRRNLTAVDTGIKPCDYL